MLSERSETPPRRRSIGIQTEGNTVAYAIGQTDYLLILYYTVVSEQLSTVIDIPEDSGEVTR